jgi:hypothetical protein
MPTLQFQSLSDSLSRLANIFQTIPDLIRNPQANPLQAAILLSIVVVLLLIVLISVILMFVRPTSDEEIAQYERLEAGEEAEETGEHPAEAPVTVREVPSAAAGVGALAIWCLLLLAVGVVWVATGITSSSSDTCTSCHVLTVHNKTIAFDPHKSVKCVECHESGGPAARVTVNVFTRVQHFVLARINPDAATGYGEPVASDACQRCHASQIAATYTDSTLGVRVSHAEPIAAGASCTDCHALQSGVVTADTVGMSPCLRCHDGKHVKSACSECHLGDPSRAIQPNIGTQLAAAQVPNPVCSGCHTDMTVCNNCHGLTMPHSPEFKAYGHALPASEAIWAGNLKLCTHCHYPGHNSCQQPGCHQGMFPSHGLAWKKFHALAKWPSSIWNSEACACHGWNPVKRQGKVFCQICHATKPKNAKS